MGWICKLPHRQCEICRFLVIEFSYESNRGIEVGVTCGSFGRERFLATCQTNHCPHGYTLMRGSKVEGRYEEC